MRVRSHAASARTKSPMLDLVGGTGSAPNGVGQRLMKSHLLPIIRQASDAARKNERDRQMRIRQWARRVMLCSTMALSLIFIASADASADPVFDVVINGEIDHFARD